MASYTFSTITDVLLLGEQRAYVPRAARPHLCWATQAADGASSSSSLGAQSRLKGDGTAARETIESQKEAEQEHETHRIPHAADASEVALRALLTTDSATGNHLALYHDRGAPHIARLSSIIPSQRRVVALWSPPPPRTSCDGVADLLNGAVPVYVSDCVGNLFRYEWAAEGTEEPAAKRRRGEAEDATDARAANAGTWTAVASARSAVPSGMATSVGSPSSTPHEELFAVTRGVGGWAGLTALNVDDTSNAAAALSSLVSVREFYHDVRVVDPVKQTVVRTYGTTHAPTGLLCPFVTAAPHCVLVTEGCLATLYDVRCPSAVLSLGEVYQAQAEWTAVKEAAAAAAAAAQDGASSNGGNGNAKMRNGQQEQRQQSSAPPPLLVPGRLTSTIGHVRDVCGTANPFEVACAVDRSLCVYDLRKFNRLFTSSSVLKYVIDAVASVASGRGVVCSGIDSEVRVIPLFEKTENHNGELLSMAARAATQSQKKKSRSDTLKKGEGEDGAGSAFDVESIGPGSTFRTRLSTSVSCTSVWQGGWVTTQNGGGVAAVGVSVDGEVFLAQ